MTHEQVVALARASTACRVEEAAPALGIGRNKAYEEAQAGTFPLRVWRSGRHMLVSTAELCAFLGVTIDPPPRRRAAR
jgi:excisionase family DNA binding protein